MKSFCPPPSPPDFGNITTVTLLILLQPGGEGGGQEQAKNDHFNWRLFFEGPGNHCISKKEIKTKIPNEEEIKTILTVKEFQGFITGKIFKNGIPLEATLVGQCQKLG